MFPVLARLYGEVFGLATLAARRLPVAGRTDPSTRPATGRLDRLPRAGRIPSAAARSGRSAIAAMT